MKHPRLLPAQAEACARTMAMATETSQVGIGTILVLMCLCVLYVLIYMSVCLCVYACLCLCVYVFTCGMCLYVDESRQHGGLVVLLTSVCERNTPFAQAFALQHSSRNCHPSPCFGIIETTLPRCLRLQRSVFSKTPVSLSSLEGVSGGSRAFADQSRFCHERVHMWHARAACRCD